MKRKNSLIFILIIGLFSCNQVADNETYKHLDCNSLSNKEVIFKIAQSILDNHNNENIWNLSEIDTSEFFSTEDYFINSKSKNRLVLIGGNAGLSSGSVDNLLILFSCTDTINIVWSGQVGDFSQNDILDVNGDGIKEIICKSSIMWMGQCNDIYRIFNFKNNQRNLIFEVISTSVLDCGLDNLAKIYKKGDTLENNFDCSLLNNNNEFKVKQIHTTKIHNGGLTEQDLYKNLKVIIDTTKIQLK